MEENDSCSLALPVVIVAPPTTILSLLTATPCTCPNHFNLFFSFLGESYLELSMDAQASFKAP